MPTPLSRYFADKALNRLIPHLKPGFQTLTRSLISALGEDGRGRVADLLGLLFPASTPASANASLNRLIATLNETAQAQGVPLTVAITADKKAGAAKRWVWCEGEGEGPVAYTSDLEAVRPELRQTTQRAVIMGAPIVLMTFNPHETKAVHAHFGHPTETDSTGAFPINYLGIHGGTEVWHLISGQGSQQASVATQFAIDRVKPFAIIAVGIAFGMNQGTQKIGDVLISEYIRDYELGRQNADGSFTPRSGKPRASKRLLRQIRMLEHKAHTNDWPTLHIGTMMCGDKLLDSRAHRDGLKAIEPEAIGGEMEANGIELICDEKNIDWIIVKGISDWADGTKSTANKERDQKLAADNAALVVKAMLEMGPLHPTDPPPAKPVPAQPTPQLPDRHAIPDGHYQRSVRGRAVTLQRDAQDTIIATKREGQDAEENTATDVLPALHAWATDPQAPPLLALLADYGMGKTIACQQFTTELDAARREDSRRPMPLYFDLRHVTRRQGRVPTLVEALTDCMERGWLDRGDGHSYGMEQIHEWVAQGAVIIIDGLDEVLVKLDAYEGQVFTNNLLKLFADTRARAAADGRPRHLKMLIACRTAYFPSLRAQQTHFTQQDRGEVDASHYRALMLLPWTDEQIVRYLDAALPGLSSAQVLDLIRSVHNLEELAARPFTLKLVAGHIPAIERQRALGHTVQGVTLYRAMVQRWLERDQGKHHILPEHKMRLVAHLAAYLWRSGRNALPFNELQGWFHQWRDGQPDMRRYTSMHPDQLEEDLRTATFLVRRDEGEESAFHFAHTSLFEFFLAEYLFAALRANTPEHWALPVPSAETLDFLGQMLAEAGAETVRALEGWRQPRRAVVGELLLAYALRAHKRGWPLPSLRGLDLSGGDLRGWRIDGGAQRLSLAGAVLTGCDLREAAFTNLDLSRADFSGARLDRATLIDADLTGTNFATSRLTGTVFRRCRLNDSLWTGAEGYRTQFLLCQTEAATSVDATVGLSSSKMSTPLVAPASRPMNLRQTTKLAWLAGHLMMAVSACSWSPDGRHLVSGGKDGTLCLWDAATGEVLTEFRGHNSGITSCIWSPDNRYIVSGAEDGTLRLWDAATGRHLKNFEQGTRITAYDWTPDSGRIATVRQDGILRLWDATTGQLLVSLNEHDHLITTCAWAPDGSRLATAGYDGTLCLWDTTTGQRLTRLNGHHDKITTCVWSPDGSRLASASIRGSLQFWDATTGQCLANALEHNVGITACAWSPDGSHLVIGEIDGALRLWDCVTMLPVTRFDKPIGRISSCKWSPDGSRLATTGSTGRLRLWDAASGQPLVNFDIDAGATIAFNWAPGGNRLVTVGHDQILRLWNAETGQPLAKLNRLGKGMVVHTWSSDDNRIATMESDGSMHLWDATTGQHLASFHAQGKWITPHYAWSPDGNRLVTTGRDGTLRLWDIATGQSIISFRAHDDGWITTCAWAPDGNRLVTTGRDGTLRLWDTATGQSLISFRAHDGWISTCTWAPDGNRLVTTGRDGTLCLWDTATGQSLMSFPVDGWITACTWAPDGDRLATIGRDGLMRVWCLVTGNCLRVTASWHKRDGNFAFAVWSPQENHIIAASDDAWRFLAWQGLDANGQISRWPLETFGPVCTLETSDGVA